MQYHFPRFDLSKMTEPMYKMMEPVYWKLVAVIVTALLVGGAATQYHNSQKDPVQDALNTKITYEQGIGKNVQLVYTAVMETRNASINHDPSFQTKYDYTTTIVTGKFQGADNEIGLTPDQAKTNHKYKEFLGMSELLCEEYDQGINPDLTEYNNLKTELEA